MVKKAFAVFALALITMLAIPTAANADAYVPSNGVAVSGTVTPGGTVVVAFNSGSFANGETVAFTVAGPGTATLAVIRSTVSSMNKVAGANGSVALSVTLPKDASGSYVVTGTGASSGRVGVATLTVVAASVPVGLAFTGVNGQMTLLWAVAGIILLAGAAVITMINVRRKRAQA